MALNRLVVVLIAAATLAFSLIFARQLILHRDLPREEWLDRPVRVLTYGTFVSARGPGEVLFKKFEVEHRAKLEVVVADEALLERLRTGGSFDAVIGLDPATLDRAGREFEWRRWTDETSAWFEAPKHVADERFHPYEWSPLTFVGRRDDQPAPRTFDDLIDPRFAGQFVVSDPRATAPGRQFARWVAANAGPSTRAWLEKFRGNVVSVAPSWTAAYALFEHRRTRFVWTYLTSLAFHWGTEKNRDYVPLVFATGHPVHVTYAAVPSTCRACALGETLVRSLLEAPAQDIIMKRDFMMPVLRGSERGTVFADLPALELVHLPGGDLTDWNAVFTR